MSWKEFLEDYEAKELEDYESFKKKFIEDKLDPEETFPSTDRFPELRKPICRLFRLECYSAKDNIWSRIPLSGSTVCGLPSFPESIFEKNVGFSVKQIPRVIDFVKDTGKLQFVLRHYPTAYLDAQFLEPILTELRPPLGVNFPPDAFFGKQQLHKYMVEFDTLAESKVTPSIIRWSIETTGSKRNAEVLLGDYRHTYACLKGLGYQDIVDELEFALVTDVGKAAILTIIGGVLITQPLFDPLARSFIIDANLYEYAVEFAKAHLLDIPEPSFPGEIGEFLIRKLVHCAPSLDACKQLIFKYEDEDVYKLAQALNQGIFENEPDVVSQSGKDLSMVLDHIWKDKKLPNRIKELKIGVPVLFGVIGALACGIPGGIGGLLTGLGFSVGDKFVGGMSEAIAEKIAKIGSPNWELIVYDFKKKYGLNR